MPVTSCTYIAMPKINSTMDDMIYLTGEELEQRIAQTSDNSRSLVRYSRWSREYIFPECNICGAPKIIHRNMEFDTCNGQPSTEFIETMVDMLNQTKGVEKFIWWRLMITLTNITMQKGRI